MSRRILLTALPALLAPWRATADFVTSAGGSAAHGITPLYSTFSSVGNGADTTEDTLQTYVVPASTLVNVGDRFRIELFGTLAASADTKTIRVRLNAGTAIATYAASAAGQTTWALWVSIAKTGPNAQSATGQSLGSSNSSNANGTTTSITDTSPITITVTGQNSTTATAGSLTCRYMTVDYLY